ncbi:MAG TPA: response regulator, partial [Nocardioides sp.]|nr:response regulator [Nocardioides sp.]
DVALLDVEMPGLDGISATAEVRAAAPETRVLIVTTFGRPGYLRRALQAGAAGFVGSNVVRALNDRGETDIIAVDNLAR